MFKVLIYQFQKNIYLHIYLVNKKGVKPYNFSFSIFMTVLLIFFFINIIRYIECFVGISYFPEHYRFYGTRNEL